MLNITEKFIYYFETGEKNTQIFFDEILKSALNYKYKNLDKTIPLVSSKDLTDAIFGIYIKVVPFVQTDF